MYADIAARDFAIGEKVLGRSQKQFLFWDFRSKKAISSGCNPGGAGCRVRLGICNGTFIYLTSESSLEFFQFLRLHTCCEIAIGLTASNLAVFIHAVNL